MKNPPSETATKTTMIVRLKVWICVRMPSMQDTVGEAFLSIRSRALGDQEELTAAFTGRFGPQNLHFLEPLPNGQQELVEASSLKGLRRKNTGGLEQRQRQL